MPCVIKVKILQVFNPLAGKVFSHTRDEAAIVLFPDFNANGCMCQAATEDIGV